MERRLFDEDKLTKTPGAFYDLRVWLNPLLGCADGSYYGYINCGFAGGV